MPSNCIIELNLNKMPLVLLLSEKFQPYCNAGLSVFSAWSWIADIFTKPLNIGHFKLFGLLSACLFFEVFKEKWEVSAGVNYKAQTQRLLLFTCSCHFCQQQIITIHQKNIFVKGGIIIMIVSYNVIYVVWFYNFPACLFFTSAQKPILFMPVTAITAYWIVWPWIHSLIMDLKYFELESIC